MKPVFILVIIFFSFYLRATTFYVSSSNGNNNNNGLSAQFPFNSLDKLNTMSFFPGDTILFKSGDYFQGMFWIKGSGSFQQPIILDSYAGIVKPIINGNGYQAAILIYNNEHICINNLEISNVGSHLDLSGNIKRLNGFGGAAIFWGSG